MNFDVKARFQVLFASVFWDVLSWWFHQAKLSEVLFWSLWKKSTQEQRLWAEAISLLLQINTLSCGLFFPSTGVLFQINLLTVRREDYPEENMHRFLLKKKNTLNFSWHIEQLSHNMGTMMMGRVTVSFQQAVRFKVTWEVRSDSVLRTQQIFFIHLWNFYSLTT